MRIKVIIFIFLSLLFSGLPLIAQAAILYLEPSQGTYYQNDVFIAKVWLDTEQEEINAGEINLQYFPDLLTVEEVSAGASIFTLWIKEPEESSKNTISFMGGIPNGFNGKGLVGKIVFKAEKEGKVNIQFQKTSQVLLNDGKGTKAVLTTKGAIFNISAEKPEVPRNEWEEEIKRDNIPPEPFKIEIGKDPSIFEGKYFIAFSTTDKGTGIDHYEVKEGGKDWQEATSPYLLEDQSLKNIIFVRAIDKAGNERVEIWNPTQEYNFKNLISWIILISVGIGVIAGIKKFRRQNIK